MEIQTERALPLSHFNGVLSGWKTLWIRLSLLATQLLPEKNLSLNGLVLGHLFLLAAMLKFLPGANIKTLKSGGLNPTTLALVVLTLSGIVLELLIQLRRAHRYVGISFNFAMAFLGYAFVYYPRLPKNLIWPDAESYILNASVRGVLYPWFIDLFIPQSVQNLPWPAEAELLSRSALYAPVAWAQYGVFLLAGFLLMRFFYRRFFLGPALFFFLLAGHQIVFPKAFLSGNIWDNIPTILSESLGYSWLFGMVAFIFYLVTREKPSWKLNVLFGLYCFLGLEIAPRLLPFAAVGVIIPFFCQLRSFFERGPGTSNTMRSLVPALLTTLVFGVLVLGRCTYTRIHYGVFSPLPFNGLTSSGVAFQFAGRDDYQLIEDPLRREFAQRVLHHKWYYPNPKKDEFVNLNINYVGVGTYLEMFHSPGGLAVLPEYNRLVAPIVSTLLFKNPPARARWLEWFSRQLRYLWEDRAYFTPVHLFMIAFLFLWTGFVRWRNPLIAASALLSLLPLLSMFLCVGLQGAQPRYLSTGELLLPIVVCVALIEILRSIFSTTALSLEWATEPDCHLGSPPPDESSR